MQNFCPYTFTLTCWILDTATVFQCLGSLTTAQSSITREMSIASSNQREKANTGIWLQEACWAFRLILQPIARTNDKFLHFFLEYITLVSPPTVIIDRYSIAARKTEYACGNSMHLFIEFLFENQASLNKCAVQLLACLRTFVSSKSKIRPVCTHYEAMRNAFTLQFLIADQCSFILVVSFL